MAKKGGGSDQDVTQRTEPWAPSQPYLREILDQAQQLYGAGYGTQFYPGQTWIDPSPDTLAAQDMLRQRALGGSPLLDAAGGQIAQTLAGDYLGAGNPYFAAMSQRVSDSVLPRINAEFANAGRTGSGLHAEAAARGVTEALAPLAYQNYADERGRQMNGLMMTPQLEQAAYLPAQMLGTLGRDVESFARDALAGDMARFNAQEAAPWDLLGRYNAIAQGFGGLGGTRQTEGLQPGGRSPVQGLLGGAAGGLGLAQGLSSLGVLGAASPFAWGLPLVGGLLGLLG